MNFIKLEKAFNRALFFSFHRRRLYLTFPALVLCGTLTVFCEVLRVNANAWISLCLKFLPFFLSVSILLVLGTLLAKMYPRDINGTKINIRRFIATSMDLIIGIAYVAVPPILAYLLLWVLLGFFVLLQEIPGIGTFFSVVLSFVPFLLIVGVLLLCIFNVIVLFFVVPSVNLLSLRKGAWIKKVVSFLKLHILSSSLLFVIGLTPLLFTFFLLMIAAMLAESTFSLASGSFAHSMKWFFLSVPFAALLSPSILFFFNFSSESYALLKEKE